MYKIASEFHDMLKALYGQKITNCIRYSWWSPEQSVKECGIASNNVFSETAGPVSIQLENGIILGVSSSSSLISVVMWVEKDKDGIFCEEPLFKDDELHPISAGDIVYSNNEISECLNIPISSVALIKRKPENAKWLDCPCEVGIMIKFENKKILILSHGMHDNSDDFSVITPKQIAPYVKTRIFFIDIIGYE